MARVSDFACAILIAPASALLAIVAGVLVGLLDDPGAGIGTLAGVALFVALPPATVVLRARVCGLTLDWTCLLLCLTLLSMAATVAALMIGLSLAYAYFMSDF